MTPLEKALEIIGIDPLPADAYQKLVRLESDAAGEDKQRFEWVWEGYIVAGGTFPDGSTP